MKPKEITTTPQGLDITMTPQCVDDYYTLSRHLEASMSVTTDK